MWQYSLQTTLQVLDAQPLQTPEHGTPGVALQPHFVIVAKSKDEDLEGLTMS